jgi:lipopolysaccharide O-acetyltransferase
VRQSTTCKEESGTVGVCGGVQSRRQQNHLWKWASLPNRLRRFLRENGWYVFGTNLAEFSRSAIRNHLISRKLGIKKVNIGPAAYLRGLCFIEMGEDFSAGRGLWLEAISRYNDEEFTPRIVIGNHVRISQFAHIAATHLVEIGDNVLIGSKVMITDHNHGQYAYSNQSSPQTSPTDRRLDRERCVVIGRNVWLGDGVVVTAGSSIGEGSVIGANSVVHGSIPAFTIAAGAPATVRKVFNFDAMKWCNIG